VLAFRVDGAVRRDALLAEVEEAALGLRLRALGEFPDGVADVDVFDGRAVHREPRLVEPRRRGLLAPRERRGPRRRARRVAPPEGALAVRRAGLQRRLEAHGDVVVEALLGAAADADGRAAAPERQAPARRLRRRVPDHEDAVEAHGDEGVGLRVRREALDGRVVAHDERLRARPRLPLAGRREVADHDVPEAQAREDVAVV
jgi:hypothetical protein